MNDVGKKHKHYFYGDESDNLFAASSGSDTVYGYGGDDVIHDADTNAADAYFGGKGNDTIYTDGGYDLIEGRVGRDLVISNNYGDFFFDGGFGVDTLDFQVLSGHTLDITEVSDEKTVIKVFDEATGEQTQKVVLFNVEHIDWWMVG